MAPGGFLADLRSAAGFLPAVRDVAFSAPFAAFRVRLVPAFAADATSVVFLATAFDADFWAGAVDLPDTFEAPAGGLLVGLPPLLLPTAGLLEPDLPVVSCMARACPAFVAFVAFVAFAALIALVALVALVAFAGLDTLVVFVDFAGLDTFAALPAFFALLAFVAAALGLAAALAVFPAPFPTLAPVALPVFAAALLAAVLRVVLVAIGTGLRLLIDVLTVTTQNIHAR